ncbi:MAG: hypothetical protein NUW01_15980 [Gemmatimonadaceae bacterium]|nr:hypothetical protein [Gemmatimonadaceae bacterium]
MTKQIARTHEQNQAERAFPVAAKISQADGAAALFAYCGLVNNA